MRLELSVKTDLALRALDHLTSVQARIGRRALADHLGTSPDFLARVMSPLVRAGWVASHRGKTGGYEITGAAASASVFDVIAVQEGLPGAGQCVLRTGPCNPDEQCALHDPWTKARDAMLAELRIAPAITTEREVEDE